MTIFDAISVGVVAAISGLIAIAIVGIILVVIAGGAYILRGYLLDDDDWKQ